MIPLRDTVAVLLCAGLSRRYGEGNKLLAKLDGKPLAAHAAGLLRSLPFLVRVAVVGDDVMTALLGGFEVARNPEPERGQDSSVRIGIEAGLALRPQGVMICLGDMPFVTPAHLEALTEAATEGRAAISFGGEWRSPPLLLPVGLAQRVLEQPDLPVRSFVAGAVEVLASPAILRDFDTVADFNLHRSP